MIQPWYDQSDQTTSSKIYGFVVPEYKLADHLPTWKLRVLDRLAVMVSEAVREMLEKIAKSLFVTIRPEVEGKKSGLLMADLEFTVNAERAGRITDLLAKKKIDEELGIPTGQAFSNAYQFVSCQPHTEHPGVFTVVSRLALYWSPTEENMICQALRKGDNALVDKGKTDELQQTYGQPRLLMIPATTAFQQLLGTYFSPRILEKLPRQLRAGACQEVAQQVTSYLGQRNSTRVKGEVNFPTVETRDPQIRQAEYETAIDDLVRDLRPLEKARVRDIYPGEYKTDDPRGDRVVIHDERWYRVTHSAHPSPFTLFFVQSNAIKLVAGSYTFPAGVAKSDRHRGNLQPSVTQHQTQTQRRVLLIAKTGEVVFTPPPGVSPKQADSTGLTAEARLAHQGKVRLKWGWQHIHGSIDSEDYGPTRLNALFASLPFECDDQIITDILKQRDEGRSGEGRGLDLNLQHLPVTQPSINAKTGKARPPKLDRFDMLLPLSTNRDRGQRVLRRRNLEIAWHRFIQKSDGWYYQPTLSVPITKPAELPNQPVLGVAFTLDAIASWCLVAADGAVLEEGRLAPNPQILEFVKSKEKLEGRQRQGRWTGGRRFAHRLKGITHNVVGQILEVVKKHACRWALEDIGFVQKSSADSAKNFLHAAWNYGQLRTFATYRGELAGLGTPCFISGFITRDEVDGPAKARVVAEDARRYFYKLERLKPLARKKPEREAKKLTGEEKRREIQKLADDANNLALEITTLVNNPHLPMTDEKYSTLESLTNKFTERLHAIRSLDPKKKVCKQLGLVERLDISLETVMEDMLRADAEKSTKN